MRPHNEEETIVQRHTHPLILFTTFCIHFLKALHLRRLRGNNKRPEAVFWR
jgi:hypothetical protein